MPAATRPHYLIFAVLISLIMAVAALGFVTTQPLTGDSHQNVRIAYHLVHTGVWGFDNVETPDPRPQIRREPIPVLAPAALMLLDPAFNGPFSISDVTEGQLVARIKRVNAVWIFLTSLAIFLVTAELFGPAIKAAAFSVLVVLASAYVLFLPSMAVMETEVPAAFFLLLATWSGMRFARERSARNALLLGGSLGLLSLVKAAFLFIGVGYIGLLLLLQPPISEGKGRFCRRNVFLYGLIAVAMIVTVTPWVVRNIVEFRQPVITSRGGDVLAFRALLTEHPLDEWLYDFSPDNVRPAVAAALGLALKDKVIDARYAQLKRGRWEIYRKRLTDAGLKLSKRRAESWLAAQAVKYYAQNPTRYALSSLLFAYRGIWFVRPPDASEGVREPLRMLVTVVIAVAFLSLLSLFVWALIRLDPTLTAFTGLAIGSYLFYSLFTHNIPRYSEPLLPFVVLSMVWWLDAASIRLRDRLFGRQDRFPAHLAAP